MRGCTRKPSLQWPGWAPDPCCRHACCCCARCRICSPLTAHCAPSSPRAAARPSSRPRLLRPVAVFGAPLALNPNHPVGGGKPGGVHSHLPRWRGGELGGQLSSAQPSRFFCALPVPARGTAVVNGRMRRSGRQNVYQSKVVDILSTRGASQPPTSPPACSSTPTHAPEQHTGTITPPGWFCMLWGTSHTMRYATFIGVCRGWVSQK